MYEIYCENGNGRCRPIAVHLQKSLSDRYGASAAILACVRKLALHVLPVLLPLQLRVMVLITLFTGVVTDTFVHSKGTQQVAVADA
jgi:hypothetical protein